MTYYNFKINNKIKNNSFLTNKNDIEAWLNEYKITNYKLIKTYPLYGYVVDVHDKVNLQNKNLSHIPIKFNIITGGFDCSDNDLTNLSFAPVVIRGYFDFSNNKIQNLRDFPKKVGGSIFAKYNQINSLRFLPKKINGILDLSSNKLKNLKFTPEEISDFFSFANNQVDTLFYFPKKAKKIFAELNPQIHIESNKFMDFYIEHIKEFEIISNYQKLNSQLNSNSISIIKTNKI